MGLKERIAQIKTDRVVASVAVVEKDARQAADLEAKRLELRTQQKVAFETYRASVLPALSDLLQQVGARELLEEYRVAVWGGIGQVDTEPEFDKPIQKMASSSPRLTLSLRYPYNTATEKTEDEWSGGIDGSWSTKHLGWFIYPDETRISVSVDLDPKLLVEARHSNIYEYQYVPDRISDEYHYPPIERLGKLDPNNPTGHRKSLEDFLVEIGLEDTHPLKLRASADALLTHHNLRTNVKKVGFLGFFK